jgi:hypothetical protein
MKWLVRFFVVLVPVLAGIMGYRTGSDYPRYRFFVSYFLGASIFSIGLLLSTFPLGRVSRWLVLILVLVSAFLHIVFAPYYGTTALVITIVIEVYAGINLFRREVSE